MKEATEEELLATKIEIRKAVERLYELSADPKIRAVYEQRMKAWRDRKSEINGQE